MADEATVLSVVLRLENEHYGIEINRVREMLAMPPVSAMPKVPAHVRGLINLRGKVIPVVDLRMRLGMKSLVTESEEMINLMHQREQDHRRWVETLETCIREGTEFTLARDPHQCAFGKWYDTYEAKNFRLARLLERFDAPHKAVHRIAGEALSLAAAGKQADALDLIEQTRHGALAAIIDLFGQLRKLLSELAREIAVVVESATGAVALAVDEVTSVEQIRPQTGDDSVAASVKTGGIVKSVCLRADNKSIAMMLETDKLLGVTAAAA